jgi:hypothetical protein
VNSTQLLPAIRELYSRHPECFHHKPWKLQQGLFSLGYVDTLVGDGEIAGAVDVAGGDYLQMRPAA